MGFVGGGGNIAISTARPPSFCVLCYKHLIVYGIHISYFFMLACDFGLRMWRTASVRGLFDYDLNDRTRNNEAKLIVKHFNTSVAQHFYPIKITTTWNALPSEVVSSRTVNSFKNSLDKHWTENPPNVRVNW